MPNKYKLTINILKALKYSTSSGEYPSFFQSLWTCR